MRLLTFLAVLLLVATAPAFHQQSRKELMQEYARRYKSIDKKDVAALTELAEWCAEKKLRTYKNLLFKKVLKLDPQNDKANAAMGNEKIDGTWHTPEEAAAIRAEREAAARAAAAAKVAKANASKLDLPDEDGDRAAVKSQLGKNEDAAKQLLDEFIETTGLVKTKFCSGITDHMMFVAKAPKQFVPHLAQIGEYTYRKLSWITFGKKDSGTFTGGGKIAFYLASDAALEMTLDFLKKRHPGVTSYNNLVQEAKDVRKYSLEFTTLHTPPIHVHLNPENQPSTVANVMARSWLEHNARPWYGELDITRAKAKDFSMMSWMLEGLGIWASLDAVGVNRLYRIQKPQYANKKMIDKEVELNYPEIAFDAVTKGKFEDFNARTFYQLNRSRMNTWHMVDLAMSFALVDYLIRKRLDDWRGLVKKLKTARTYRGAFIRQFGTEEQKKRAGVVLGSTHRDGDLERIYRPVAEKFEQEWREWVKEAYEELRDDPEKFTREAPFAKRPKVRR